MIKLKITPDLPAIRALQPKPNSQANFIEQEIEIVPTYFPDGTSQIWKLPKDIKDTIQVCLSVEIIWTFEKEAELIQVCQLTQLIQKLSTGYIKASLFVPYLPYGRQDKEIGNDECFAQTTFWSIILRFFTNIRTIDVHSNNIIGKIKDADVKIANVSADEYIKLAIYECRPTLICFPDKGASERNYNTQKLKSFHLEKHRDSATGNILGLKSPLPLNLKDQKVLILDDICDGGRTFIEAAKLLYEMGAEEVHLYVTHGIFSKGTQVLKDAGIKRIFTYKGEVQ